MNLPELTLDILGTVRAEGPSIAQGTRISYMAAYPLVSGDVKRADSTFAIMSKPIATWPKASFGQSERFASLLQQTSQSSILDIEACFPDSVVGFVADQERRTRGL